MSPFCGQQLPASKEPDGARKSSRNNAYGCFGVINGQTASKFDFRFAPEIGLKSDIRPCPFRATTGLMHRNKWHRSDHLVSKREHPID